MLAASYPTILSSIADQPLGECFETVAIAMSPLSLRESLTRRCRLVVYSSPTPAPSSATCSFRLTRL